MLRAAVSIPTPSVTDSSATLPLTSAALNVLADLVAKMNRCFGDRDGLHHGNADRPALGAFWPPTR
jgi:hypothetical protein